MAKITEPTLQQLRSAFNDQNNLKIAFYYLYFTTLCTFSSSTRLREIIRPVSLREHYQALNAPMFGFVDTVEECYLAKNSKI